MWFIGVEVEQETSAPLPKKSWIRPWSWAIFFININIYLYTFSGPVLGSLHDCICVHLKM